MRLITTFKTLFTSLFKNLRSLTKSLADFLYPKTRHMLALEELPTEKLLALLPQSTLSGKGNVIALFDYTHTLTKEIIWEVKYNGNRILAQNLGAILYDVIISELEEQNIFEKYKSVVLMPMPISDKRRFERGWNQTELLTRAVKHLDQTQRFKFLERQLAKITHTESQTKTASKAERQRNLHESMKVMNPESVRERFVVLVDDVTTTGSTFKEAERALKAAGAKKVFCVAIAH